MEKLIVVRPFGPWKVGDIVDSPAEMSEILTSEQSAHVVRIHSVEEN